MDHYISPSKQQRYIVQLQGVKLTITWDLEILCDSLRQGINKLHKPLAEVWDGLSAHFHSPLLFVAIDTAAHELGLGWSITWSHIHTWWFFNFPSSKCVNYCIIGHCTMLPLSTKSCLKSSKLRPILNGQFCHGISKNICLNVLGSKQPWEILVFVIFKL